MPCAEYDQKGFRQVSNFYLISNYLARIGVLAYQHQPFLNPTWHFCALPTVVLVGPPLLSRFLAPIVSPSPVAFEGTPPYRERVPWMRPVRRGHLHDHPSQTHSAQVPVCNGGTYPAPEKKRCIGTYSDSTVQCDCFCGPACSRRPVRAPCARVGTRALAQRAAHPQPTPFPSPHA